MPKNQNAKAFMQPFCISKDKILDQPPADQVWDMKMSSDLQGQQFLRNIFQQIGWYSIQRKNGKPTLITVPVVPHKAVAEVSRRGKL